MTNRVEILRTLLFTKEDYDTITNAENSFSDLEIEFMIEFKKIYELGLTQLEKFLDKLEEKGHELDIYTIMYYMELLRNGPLGAYLPSYTADKTRYWSRNTPDTLGLLGNKNKSPQNVTIYQGVEYPLGSEVNTFNRSPGFMQATSKLAIQLTEDMFRSGLMSSSMVDNTLPIADKRPDLRYSEEPTGQFVLRPNASYMVKDRYFYLEVEKASAPVFDKVKEYLTEPEVPIPLGENWRMYKEKKQYTPFDSGKNTSKSTNTKVKKEFTYGEDKEIITLDLMGDEFDSEDRRASVLKISNPIKDEEYKLNTNEGQLGD